MPEPDIYERAANAARALRNATVIMHRRGVEVVTISARDAAILLVCAELVAEAGDDSLDER
jgi:hypothetical protein